MSSITDLVAELVRAANEAGRLDRTEVVRLLDRAARTIRELRESVGIPAEGTAFDALLGIERFLRYDQGHDMAEASRMLLEAADMVRTLRIVADTGIEIRLSAGGDWTVHGQGDDR